MTIFCTCIATSYAQKITQIKQDGKIIVIEYSLDKDADYVDLYVSLNGGKNFKGPLKYIEGNLKDVTAGNNKYIRWNTIKEFGELKSDDIQFKLLVKMKKEWKKESFFTVNAAYSIAPQLSYGLTFGQIKRFGWYVSLMSSTDFQGLSTDLTCNKDGYIDGLLPFYSKEKSTTRISGIVGGIFKIIDPLCVKAGIGYGNRTVCWKTKDERWVKNNGLSVQGIDATIGLQGNINGFVISLEMVTTEFETLEAKLGLGFSLGRKK